MLVTAGGRRPPRRGAAPNQMKISEPRTIGPADLSPDAKIRVYTVVKGVEHAHLAVKSLASYVVISHLKASLFLVDTQADEYVRAIAKEFGIEVLCRRRADFPFPKLKDDFWDLMFIRFHPVVWLNDRFILHVDSDTINYRDIGHLDLTGRIGAVEEDQGKSRSLTIKRDKGIAGWSCDLKVYCNSGVIGFDRAVMVEFAAMFWGLARNDLQKGLLYTAPMHDQTYFNRLINGEFAARLLVLPGRYNELNADQPDTIIRHIAGGCSARKTKVVEELLAGFLRDARRVRA